MKFLYKNIVLVYKMFFQEKEGHKNCNLNTNKKKSYLFFCLGILIHFTFSTLFFESILFSGEFWAESATNYFHHSRFSSFQQFFILDAGYLNIPIRFISSLIHLLKIPLEVVPYSYNVISLILISLMVFIFCLPMFRVVLPSDNLRFFICLILSVIGGFEVRTFINFMYYSSIFALFVNSYLLTNKNKNITWWLYGLPFIFVSKAILLAFLPIFLLSFFRINRKGKLLYLLCFLTAFINVCCLSFEEVQNSISLLDKILIYFKITSRHLTGLVLNHDSLFQNAFFLYLSPLLSLFFLFKLLKIFFQWTSPMRFVLLQGILLIFITNCISVIGGRTDDLLYLTNYYDIKRITILPTFGIILIAFCVIEFYCEKRKNKNNRIVWFLIWICLSGNGWFIVSKLFSLPKTQTMAWKANSHNIYDSSFCIAIEPYAWTYKQNCNIIFSKQILKPASNIGIEKNTPFYYTGEIPNQIKNHTTLSLTVHYKPKTHRDNHLLSLKIGDLTLNQNISVRHYMIKTMKVQFTIPKTLKIKEYTHISVFFDKQVISKQESVLINWYGN